MQVQIDIEIDQLLKIVRELPAGKLMRLKAEMDKEVNVSKTNDELENLLLKGPVATEEQIRVIEDNRKAINGWRTS